jgi:hypothetical protein
LQGVIAIRASKILLACAKKYCHSSGSSFSQIYWGNLKQKRQHPKVNLAFGFLMPLSSCAQVGTTYLSLVSVWMIHSLVVPTFERQNFLQWRMKDGVAEVETCLFFKKNMMRNPTNAWSRRFYSPRPHTSVKFVEKIRWLAISIRKDLNRIERPQSSLSWFLVGIREMVNSQL